MGKDTRNIGFDTDRQEKETRRQDKKTQDDKLLLHCVTPRFDNIDRSAGFSFLHLVHKDLINAIDC